MLDFQKAPIKPPVQNVVNHSKIDIRSLVMQYLKESQMIHSAFCFKHEAKIEADNFMSRDRLINLVEKGLNFEQHQIAQNSFYSTENNFYNYSHKPVKKIVKKKN